MKTTKHPVQVLHLMERREFIPAIARLLHCDWGGLEPWSDLLRIQRRLESACTASPFPRALVAVSEGGALMGTASVKLQELPGHPDKEHWLGEVYVPIEFRGHGVGKRLIESAAAHAFAFGAPCLYLYTPDKQPLYANLGWKPIGETAVNGERVTLMGRPADA